MLSFASQAHAAALFVTAATADNDENDYYFNKRLG